LTVLDLDCAGRPLSLARTAIVGILNVTPDSFSDGGKFIDRERAVEHAVRMVEEGASMLDIGGESTRPGAQAVSVNEEMDRILPVIEAVSREVSVPLSVDTAKPEVMRAAVKAGAGFINDVYALRRPGALQAAAELNVPVCLMHMQGEPRTMQQNPVYNNVIGEVRAFLSERVTACEAAGIARERIVVDPGFGFGKSLAHNFALLRELREFAALGVPVMAGLSRKSMIGNVLGLEATERVHASVALALIAAQNGARLLRVHDVRPTVQAIRMWEAVQPEFSEREP
jgi:dihydropteroate synthase